ncbi:MFS transporter [Pseudomonas sp. v388]|uniref:MFS transporter n=1 Tax=Pseudomonas sp. v388 TaxID=2479849 RepID=UPI000F789501|nr:MFS transporter [Pseudomonas sp. v388]RRV06821.1 MFS transporter [Pseudomonas sp. v388]
MEWLGELAQRSEWLMAGLLGAVISGWWHKTELVDWRARIIFVITGATCSVYLTGIASNYLGIADPRNVAGVGFLLGSFGGASMAAINRALLAADIWKFLTELVRNRFDGR